MARFGYRIALGSVIVLVACSRISEREEPAPPGAGNDGVVEAGPPSPAAGEGEAELTYHRDVRPLLERRCGGCHGEGSANTVRFATYEDTYGLRGAIRTAVTTRRMPPWLAEPGHQTYRDDRTLKAEEIALLERWTSSAAVEGNPADYVAPPRVSFVADVAKPILGEGVSYLPLQDRPDDYRCFVVPLDGLPPSKRYVTGFHTVPGNTKVVHHLVAHVVTKDIVPLLQELDADEAGMGYGCYGGALPDRLGSEEVQKALEAKHPGALQQLQAGTYWLSHWAPGMDGGFVFPKGTGVRLPDGAALVVQMHYYSEGAKGSPDEGTTLALSLAEAVEKPAFYFPLSKNEWLLGRKNGSLVVPARGEASYAAAAKLSDITAYGKRILGLKDATVEAVEVHSANLHMHSIGASGTVTLGNLAQGSTETLLAIPRWDLQWQMDFPLLEPKVIAGTDLANWEQRVTCNYKNVKGAPVYGGFGSMDEMCFDFGYYALRLAPPSADAGAL
jgi:hypothetical protein